MGECDTVPNASDPDGGIANRKSSGLWRRSSNKKLSKIQLTCRRHLRLKSRTINTFPRGSPWRFALDARTWAVSETQRCVKLGDERGKRRRKKK